MSDKSNLLFSLAGRVSTWPKRALTSACRNRTPPYDAVVLREQLRSDYMALSELRRDAEGVSDKLAGSAKTKRETVGYMMGEPEKTLSLIRSQYRREYEDEYRGKCPFEKSGSKKACNGCPVPGQVFGQAEKAREK